MASPQLRRRTIVVNVMVILEEQDLIKLNDKIIKTNKHRNIQESIHFIKIKQFPYENKLGLNLEILTCLS
jgi:hypothetical protein